MKLPSWKTTQRLALIAIIVFLTAGFISNQLYLYFQEIDLGQKLRGQEPFYTTALSYYPYYVTYLRNVGFAYWLAVLANGPNMAQPMWAIFGLLFGVNGVILFYLLSFAQSYFGKSEPTDG